MTIGDSIKRIRTQKGMTQKQLGDLLGISVQTVSAYESGRRRPKMETIERFADALGVVVSSLYSDPEEADDVERRLINSSSESFQARLLRAIKDLGSEISYEGYVRGGSTAEEDNKLRDEFLPRIAKFYDIPEEVLKENFGEFQECHDFNMVEIANFSEAGQQAILILATLSEAGQAAALRHLEELAQIPAYQAGKKVPAGEKPAESASQTDPDTPETD